MFILNFQIVGTYFNRNTLKCKTIEMAALYEKLDYTLIETH